MNIDERCYGYEPARSQLTQLRMAINKLSAMVRDVRSSIVEQDDPRIPYVTVQIDRVLWNDLARKP